MKVVFDIKPNLADLNVLVRALCLLNVRYLKANPHTPTLKQAKLRYINQNVGCERLLTIPQLYAAGGGDCDQLSPARAAELQVRGIKAWPEVMQISDHLYHVFVRYPSGRAEDVSAHLGMKVPPKLVAAGQRILKQALLKRLTRAGSATHGKIQFRRSRGDRGVRRSAAVGSFERWPWW